LAKAKREKRHGEEVVKVKVAGFSHPSDIVGVYARQ